MTAQEILYKHSTNTKYDQDQILAAMEEYAQQTEEPWVRVSERDEFAIKFLRWVELNTNKRSGNNHDYAFMGNVKTDEQLLKYYSTHCNPFKHPISENLVDTSTPTAPPKH